MNNPYVRRLTWLTCSVGIVAYFGYVLYKDNFAALSLIGQLPPSAIVVAFVVYSAATVVAAMVWASILSALHVKLPRRYSFAVYCMTLPGRRLPGIVWHVAGRAVVYGNVGVPKRLTAVAGVLEYGVIMVSGSLLACLLWWLVPTTVPLLVMMLPLVILIVGGFWPSGFIQWILKRLRLFQEALSFRPVDLLLPTIAYISCWVANGIILFLLGASAVPAAASALLSVIWLATLSGIIGSLLLPLPLGLGLYEFITSVLLGSIMSPSSAVTVAIVNRVLMTGFDLVWGAIGLLAYQWKKGEIRRQNVGANSE